MIESSEYRRFYGKRIDKVTNDRGTKKEYKSKRDILEKRYGKRFVVHHANGSHSDNEEDNTYLLPEELHNKIFNEAVKRIESEDKESGSHDKKMHGIYAAYKSILTMIRHFNKKYEDEGIELPEITLPKSVKINGASSFEEIDSYRQSRLSKVLTDILLMWKSDPNNLIFKVSEVEEDNIS